MIRVVLDTNVLVSALLRAKSNQATILSLVMQKQLKLCLTKDIYDEYRTVLRRPKFAALDQTSVKQLLQHLRKNALFVTPKIFLDVIRKDPSDNIFLECAVTAKVDYIITGNTKHFDFTQYENSAIATPQQFIIVLAEKLLI